MASFSCEECKQWVYDFRTGKREEYQSGEADNVMPVKRPGPPPCRLGEKCARESPEHEADYSLTERNQRMLIAYREHRACGIDPRDPPDGIRRWAFGILDRLHREWETMETARRIAQAIGG